MRKVLIAAAGLVFVLLLQTSERAGAQSGAGSTPAPLGIDAAFKQFWDAGNPDQAAAAVAAVVRSGVSVTEAMRRLKQGRTYGGQVDRGVVRLTHRIGQIDFPYTIDVPPTYDPARSYQVRVQLHGGLTGRQDPASTGRSSNGSIGQLAGAEQIYVLPQAWNDAPWWGDKQIQNLRVILDRLKRTYNVDENRVVLSGVSDGGTSAYFVAMRETTPFASFLPLNGALIVLANESLDISADIFPNNLRDKPFFVVNGMKDPLYPPDIVEPHIEHLQQNGVDVSYHPQADGVHNTAWWPTVKDSFEQFVKDHPRQPYPAKLSWETDGKDTSRRAHWLVIDELNAEDQRPALPDANRFVPGPLSGFGVRAQGRRVVAITRASSASTFDLRQGDIVTAVNGRALAEDQNLLQFLENFPADTFLTFTVLRGDNRLDLRGYFSPGAQVPRRIFRRTAPTGRVDLVRDGNTVQATTRGVAAFTLLLSPDVFDFSKPVKVVADGRTVFDGSVSADLATMLRWSARDNDRTMIFGAEINVKLPK